MSFLAKSDTFEPLVTNTPLGSPVFELGVLEYQPPNVYFSCSIILF